MDHFNEKNCDYLKERNKGKDYILYFYLSVTNDILRTKIKCIT